VTSCILSLPINHVPKNRSTVNYILLKAKMPPMARIALLAACRAWQQQAPLAAVNYRAFDFTPAGATQHRRYAASAAGVVPADLAGLDTLLYKGLIFHGFHGTIPAVCFVFGCYKPITCTAAQSC
jgi:hypothetical protein